jgi:hypothetical protein
MQPVSQSASIRPFTPGQTHAGAAYEDLDREKDQDGTYGDEAQEGVHDDGQYAEDGHVDNVEEPAGQPATVPDNASVAQPASAPDQSPADIPVDSDADEPYIRNPDSWDAAETEKTGDAPKSDRPGLF